MCSSIMRPWCGTFIFVLLTFSKAHAQSLFKHPSVGARFFYGSFLTRQPKAAYLRDSYSYFGEISVQQQTDGRYPWQRVNGLPQVGVALHFGNTGSKHYMGNMAALFPFINWKLYQSKNVRSGLRAGAGLGWVQKPYDKITNHKQVLIGTHANAYINFLWDTEIRLFSNLHISAGISFTHLSNGSSTLPNLGLNIPALSIGLRYSVGENNILKRPRQDTLIKKKILLLFTSVGLKQAPWIEGKRYVVNTLQIEWSRTLHHSGNYNVGAALFYNPALEINPAGILDQKQSGKNVQAGIFVGYEHLLGRLSVPLQLGVYVYNHNTYPSLFQQLGLRYRINPHWSAQAAMKAHTGRADFIHLGVGYRFK